MRRAVRGLILIAAFVVALLAVQAAAVACPTCGEALGHQNNGYAKGFYYSILFMMGTPYLILCTFCGCMYWKVRRARAARAAKADVLSSASRRDSSPTPALRSSAPAAESREPVEV